MKHSVKITPKDDSIGKLYLIEAIQKSETLLANYMLRDQKPEHPGKALAQYFQRRGWVVREFTPILGTKELGDTFVAYDL